MVDPDDTVEEEEYFGPYTSCAACGGNGCDRCVDWMDPEEETDG